MDKASPATLITPPKDVRSELPISTWNYKTDAPRVRHMGPMAEDFHAVFGLGADEQHISPLDANGVALAAIQGLYGRSQNQAARIQTQAARIEDLEAFNREQAATIDALKEVCEGQGTVIEGLRSEMAALEARLAAIEEALG